MIALLKRVRAAIASWSVSLRLRHDRRALVDLIIGRVWRALWLCLGRIDSMPLPDNFFSPSFPLRDVWIAAWMHALLEAATLPVPCAAERAHDSLRGNMERNSGRKNWLTIVQVASNLTF